MAYDPDALDESAEAAEISGEITGEIVSIDTDTAYNIFGEKTQSEPDKEMMVVTVDPHPEELDNEVEVTYSLPREDGSSWLNPTFGLARFRAKYGGVPREGMDVELTTNANGFLDIAIPSTVDVGSQD